MNLQLQLFSDQDASYARQVQLMAQMVEDGRIQYRDYKVFVQRLAQTLKHKQLTNS